MTALAARWTLAMMFFLSGIGKGADTWSLRSLFVGWLGAKWGTPAAYGVIVIEVGMGGLLIATSNRTVPLVSGLVLIGFSIYVVAALLQGETECLCLGAFGDPPLSWLVVARNVFLLLITGIAEGPLTTTGLAEAPVAAVALGIAGAGIIVLGSFAQPVFSYFSWVPPRGCSIPIVRSGTRMADVIAQEQAKRVTKGKVT